MRIGHWIVTSMWAMQAAYAGEPLVMPYTPESDEASYTENTGNPVVEFSAAKAEHPPTNWQMDAETGTLQIIRDPALDGGAYLRIEMDADAPALVQVPVQTDGRGRMIVQMSARSPQAKWWIISVVAGGKTLWQHNFPLSSSWQNGAWEIQVSAADMDTATAELQMEFRGPGAVEVESLGVRVIDDQALRASALARHGGRAPENLLRNSRLPLGLQAGWNLDRHHDDGTNPAMVPDDNVPGNGGWPALRVTSDKGLRIYSEPFAPALPGEMHVASVFVRGEGEVTMRVLQDAMQLEELIEFTGSADWTRLELAFPTTASARHYALQIDAKGTVWLDAFQVHDGTKARDYTSADLCEAALTAARPSRVVYDDEPATVKWAVTDAPDGAQLRGKVVNLYGGQAVFKPVPLDASAIAYGEIDMNVFPDKPLGTLRYEVWVTNREGRRISPYNEIVIHRVRRPRHEAAFAPESPFGIHTFPTTRHLEMARAIGLTWVRLHDAGGLEWFSLEPERGKWKFRDDVVERFRAEKFEILGLFSTSPLWANTWPGDDKPLIHGFWDKFGAPGDLEAFENYVRTVGERYRDDIRIYEVWNEPWIPRFFSGNREPQPRGEPHYFHSKNPQADYAQISRVAAGALEGIDGIALIGLNSTAGEGISNRISGSDWSTGVVEADGTDAMDAVSYHHYTTARTGYAGDDVERGFERAISPVMKDGTSRKPVWFTEGSNTPAGISSTFYNHAFTARHDTDFAEHADALVRFVVTLLAAGNEKIFLYSMHAHGVLGGSYRFSTLVTPDGYLHPDAVAFSNLAWWLEGRRFVRSTTTPAGTQYLFAATGDPDDIAIVTLPAADSPGAESVANAIDIWGNPTGPNATSHAFFLQGDGHE